MTGDVFELTEQLKRIAVALERIANEMEPTTEYATAAELAERGRCPRRGGGPNVGSWQCIRPVGHFRQHVAENGHSW